MFMWHVTMCVYVDVCVYVHVHVFMLYLDVLAYESMWYEGQGSRSGIFLSSFSTWIFETKSSTEIGTY